MGGGGGTSTVEGITGVREISSVSDEVCGGTRGDVGASLGSGGTGGGASDAAGGNLKFLLIVPLRAREGFDSSSSDSLASSGVGSNVRGAVAGWLGGEVALRVGGGMDWRLGAFGAVGDVARVEGDPRLARDIDCGRPND